MLDNLPLAHADSACGNDPPGDPTNPIADWRAGLCTAHTVTVEIPFAIAGDFVYHCHIIEHEDGGMMARIRVRPTRQAVDNKEQERKRALQNALNGMRWGTERDSPELTCNSLELDLTDIALTAQFVGNSPIPRSLFSQALSPVYPVYQGFS